jgi:hypothetical protein
MSVFREFRKNRSRLGVVIDPSATSALEFAVMHGATIRFDVILTMAEDYVDLRSLPLRQDLIRARLAPGAV